jgi:hypothetical protein
VEDDMQFCTQPPRGLVGLGWAAGWAAGGLVGLHGRRGKERRSWAAAQIERVSLLSLFQTSVLKFVFKNLCCFQNHLRISNFWTFCKYHMDFLKEKCHVG